MEISEASYQIIADLLAAHTGQQLTEGRRWRIGTSLSSIFRERGISNIDQLVCLLTMPGETQLVQDVIEALLNNETYFFRDKPTFDQLPDEIFPLLRERRANKQRLQIWCAGCSTGQEAHSLAIQFAEQGAMWDGWSIDILGTDVSQKAISVARSGHYSQFEVQRGLSVSQMLSHFDETASGWQMHSSTRSIVRFQHHNILDAAPCRQPFDMVLCRNVLLYFDGSTRQRAFDRLHQATAPDGFLMLGAGETVVGHTQAFETADGRPSIYEPVSVARSVQQRLAG